MIHQHQPIPDWSGRWLNEQSLDRRCWTVDKVRTEQRRRCGLNPSRIAWTSLRSPCLRSVTPCRCPSLDVCGGDVRFFDRRNVVVKQRPCTLDDLPMQHSRKDTLDLLHQRRLEMEQRKQSLHTDGGESRRVSSYSRRRFDSAINSRGEGPLPQTTPEEAALFFKTPNPSWSSPSVAKIASKTSTSGLRARPHSVMAASRPPPTAPTQKQRPDSEPPYNSARATLDTHNKFNHMRNSRKQYPEIHKLVLRYNTDMRVMCGHPSEQCNTITAQNQNKDLSVASGFILVPVNTKESEVNQGKSKKDNVERLSLKMEDTHFIHMDKIVDRLTIASDRASMRSVNNHRESVNDAAAAHDDNEVGPEDVEHETPGPWRCWVDDATVSTVHSQAASEVDPEDESTHQAADEKYPSAAVNGKPIGAEAIAALVAAGEGEEAQTIRNSPANKAKESKSSAGGGKTSASVVAKASQPRAAGGKRGSKDRKKEMSVELQPPPPPVEELVVEEVVEPEVEPEPEPEPEPVPPSYICPSSESKSHKAEIRRWLSQSPFRAASRTLPLM